MTDTSNDVKDEVKGLKTQDIAGLLNYQEGAIVSRILMGQAAGSVTLFAFDKGQELSEHTTPFDAMVQVIDGEVELTIGGTKFVARKGEFIVMPADVPHAVLALTQFKMLLTMIRS